MAHVPRVSIVIAARNEGDNVKKTVDSITANTSSPAFEIVLVDDGNTDGSFDFLESPPYQTRHDIVCFHYDAPVGCVRARHQGVRLARGEFIVFLDAHMAVPEGWLERLVAAATRAGPLTAITPSVTALREDTWSIQQPYAHYLKINSTFQFEWEETIHPGYLLPTAGGACVMMTRSLYFQCGGFDLGLRRWGCEFVDLILKVYAIGGTCQFEPSVCVGHLFRKTFPYPMSWRELTYNTLRVGYIHLSDHAFRRFVRRVADELPGYDRAMELFREDIDEIESRRQAQRRRLVRDPDWFVRTFLPELLENEGRLATPVQTGKGDEVHLRDRGQTEWTRMAGGRWIARAPSWVSWGDAEDRTAAAPQSRPRVSIIIPVRNEGGSLRRTLESIAENTSYPDYEVIVVDDASTDGCCDFLLEIPRDEQFQRVRVLRFPVQKGYVAAINDAAELATGDILKFLDAHQWVAPNWLTNLVARMLERDGRAVVGPVVNPLHPETWRPVGPSSHGFGTDRNLSAFWHLGPESVEADGKVPLLARHQITISRERFLAMGKLCRWYKGHGFDDFDLCLRARARGDEVLVEPTVRVAHLPKKTFINEVRWEHIVFNKLVLARLHFGPDAVERVKAGTAGLPGHDAGVQAYDEIRHLLERHPQGPPAHMEVARPQVAASRDAAAG